MPPRDSHDGGASGPESRHPRDSERRDYHSSDGLHAFIDFQKGDVGTVCAGPQRPPHLSRLFHKVFIFA